MPGPVKAPAISHENLVAHFPSSFFVNECIISDAFRSKSTKAV